MMLTPAQIKSKKFKVVHLKSGYDQDEVDDFLDRVQEDYEALWQNPTYPPESPTQVMSVPQAPPEPQISPASLERLLVAAEREAEATRQAGEVAAAEIKAEAEREASRIVAEGTNERHRAIGELEEQRARLKEKVDELIRVEAEVTARMRNALERWNT